MYEETVELSKPDVGRNHDSPFKAMIFWGDR